MLAWIDRLSNRGKAVVFGVALFIFLLSLCLWIAAIAYDGQNEFAKIFYNYYQKPVEDNRWKDFLKYAQDNNLAPEHINKLRDIFGDSYTIQTEELNSLGFAFFNTTLVLAMILTGNVLFFATFTTIKQGMRAIDKLWRESLIDQEAYNKIIQMLTDELQNNAKKENAVYDAQIINEQINKIEQEAENDSR